MRPRGRRHVVARNENLAVAKLRDSTGFRRAALRTASNSVRHGPLIAGLIACTCSVGVEKPHCLHAIVTEKIMRKGTILAAPILALALVSVLWPTAHPDVDRLGDNVYETIWLWRVPAYVHNPAWRVRWTWSDPLRAEARCCRALQPASEPSEHLRILPTASGPQARPAG